MSHRLKILHLEDLSADAELVARELRKAQLDFEIKVVTEREDFVDALSSFDPDIILSDHSLPSFNSQEAILVTREKGIMAPFILVTATVSEEYAVNVIKEGADDYILKDRLQRLPNAVSSALLKHELETKRMLADKALRISELKYKILFEGNPMPMFMVSKNSPIVIAANESAVKHYGYSKDELLSLEAWQLWAGAEADYTLAGRCKHIKKDGTVIDVEIISHELIYEERSAVLLLANDITEKLKVEAELAAQAGIRQKLITESIMLGQEKEREEIGKELHDNINQILAAARLYLSLAIKDKNGSFGEYLLKSSENLEIAMGEIRRLSQSLVAPSLTGSSLEGAIETLLLNIQPLSAMHLKLDIDDYKVNITDNNIKLMCYRVLQEQMNNILKHSYAANVLIQLRSQNGQLELIVQDDGVGFDSSKKTDGIGLGNIKNRVSLFNGIVTVRSSPGDGCTLKIVVPF